METRYSHRNEHNTGTTHKKGRNEKKECHGCHTHAHENGGTQTVIQVTVALLLMTGGLLMDGLKTEWFAENFVRLVWYLVAYAPVGLPVMKEAWEGMRKRDFFSEFTLMSVASVGAFCIGEYPEAVAVIVFYTVGEMLQQKAVDRASRDIGRLLDVRPERARVYREGNWIDIPPQDVTAGERIEVKSGERVPLDGVLLEERAMFDTSALTGESMPREIGRDDEVLAGMIAGGQAVHIRVSRPYGESTLARILGLVRDAAERKAPAEMFIRRFARIYTPAVLLLAVLIVAVPALAGAVSPFRYVFADWLYRGLVFLVISCPCALVISVPLGYFAGIGAASRTGILFKGGNYLDAVTRVNSVAFDKTGTLTEGRFEVTEIQCAEVVTESELLDLMLSVERKSTHPIAQAVVRYSLRRNANEREADVMREIAGRGMEAVFGERTVLVGNLPLLQERGIKVPNALSGRAATLVTCAVDGQYAGALILEDGLKEDAREAVEQLRGLGIGDIHLLSGDKQEVVDKYAGKLGIRQAHGALLPEDKAQYIERLEKAQGRIVAFVGDGMNDAPVLALSHVGIAMGGLGSDAAVESADVVIQTDQPSKVATAIRIGRASRDIVRQNIAGAISVKVLVLAAGALGFTTLWGAVFADVGVSLLAVANSMRILYRRN